MSQENTMIVLLVVGLVIGAGIGWMLAPSGETIIYSEDPNPETTHATSVGLNAVATLVYGAIGASLVATLASIVTLMQVSMIQNDIDDIIDKLE